MFRNEGMMLCWMDVVVLGLANKLHAAAADTTHIWLTVTGHQCMSADRELWVTDWHKLAHCRAVVCVKTFQ